MRRSPLKYLFLKAFIDIFSSIVADISIISLSALAAQHSIRWEDFEPDADRDMNIYALYQRHRESICMWGKSLSSSIVGTRSNVMSKRKTAFFTAFFSLSSTLFLKPTTALGEKNSRYFDEMLKRWNHNRVQKMQIFPPQPDHITHCARCQKLIPGELN